MKFILVILLAYLIIGILHGAIKLKFVRKPKPLRFWLRYWIKMALFYPALLIRLNKLKSEKID